MFDVFPVCFLCVFLCFILVVLHETDQIVAIIGFVFCNFFSPAGTICGKKNSSAVELCEDCGRRGRPTKVLSEEEQAQLEAVRAARIKSDNAPMPATLVLNLVSRFVFLFALFIDLVTDKVQPLSRNWGGRARVGNCKCLRIEGFKDLSS